MYQPLSVKKTSRPTSATTFMAPRGENRRDLAQLLDPSQAIRVINYLIANEGQLEKRRGLQRLLTVAGTTGITMFEKFTDDIYIFGYGTTVASYIVSTDTVTTVRDTFATNTGFEGTRYGDYFFVCNGVDRVWRISQTLDYDAQTANFTVGSILTGGTSGATAIILEDTDAGATGTLTIGNIVGTFQDDELITDSVTGSATANGTLTLAIEEVTNSPRGTQVVYAINGRLFAGVADSVYYSAIDDGTNPPFDTWTIGTLATNGGRMDNRRAGTARSIVELGENIIVFSDNGKWAFQIKQIDSAGILSKVDVFTLNRFDSGGARGAVSTRAGVLYASEEGLWQLVAIGAPDIPFSDQETIITPLLGKRFFNDIDLTNATIVHDEQSQTAYLSCARDSATNNFVIAYNFERKAITEFQGWNINRFMKDGNTIYGADSRNRRAYTCFSGFSDDGANIGTEYLQELKTGDLETRQFLKGIYVYGFLSPSTLINVRLNIYDVEGVPIVDKKRFEWTTQYNLNLSDGYGTAQYGGSAYGGDVDFGNTIESFDGFRPFIRNYHRLRIHLTASDQLAHVISWVKVDAEVKAQIRRRRLVDIT